MREVKIIFKEGNFIGDNKIIFIKELPYKIGNDKRKVRIGLFKCYCGKLFESRIHNIKKGTTKSCGCRKNRIGFKHGLNGSQVYHLYYNIKKRVFKKNTKEYKNYGGRGITMFPSWQMDFMLFYDYVSALPHFGEKGLTLDRINNNGNYAPGNLRWVTQHIQSINRRHLKNKWGYMGVAKCREKFQARIQGIHIGSFKTKEQAVIARNNYIIANNLSEYKIQEVLSCQ